MTDLHLRARAPISRVETDAEYRELLLSKLAAVVATTSEANVMVITGDIFNSREISSEILTKAMHILSRAATEIVFIGGGHDGPNPWPLRALSYSGAYYLPPGETADVGGYRFWTPEWVDDDKRLMKLLREGAKIDAEIALIHGAITAGTGYPFEHVAAADVTLEGPSLILCGHIHAGVPVTKCSGGAIVTGCGSLARTSITEIDRWPTFGVVEFLLKNDKPALKYQSYTIPMVCQEGSNVFKKPGAQLLEESDSDVSRHVDNALLTLQSAKPTASAAETALERAKMSGLNEMMLDSYLGGQAWRQQLPLKTA